MHLHFFSWQFPLSLFPNSNAVVHHIAVCFSSTAAWHSELHFLTRKHQNAFVFCLVVMSIFSSSYRRERGELCFTTRKHWLTTDFSQCHQYRNASKCFKVETFLEEGRGHLQAGLAVLEKRKALVGQQQGCSSFSHTEKSKVGRILPIHFRHIF